MKCLHCLTDFFPEFQEGSLSFTYRPVAHPPLGPNGSASAGFQVKTATCPKCRGAHIGLLGNYGNGNNFKSLEWIYPRSGAFPPPPSQVPADIAADYIEANQVLPISPKASAALARRCLQAVLTGAGYTSRNLIIQVQEAIDETLAAKALPPALRDSLDAIRNFGNFSAHPISDKTTLQIIDVEEGESEWSLELLSDLFDHYYVRPALAAERRAALAEKLSAAGKPPMRTAKEVAGAGDGGLSEAAGVVAE